VFNGGEGMCENSTFYVMESLGKGGFGTVLKCLNQHNGQLYSIKVTFIQNFKTEPDDEKREANNLKIFEALKFEYAIGSHVCEHDNIAKYHGFGQDQDGDVCIVMELLEGGSLRDLIVKGAPNDDDLYKYLDQVTAALKHMHEKGVFHRDIKPENVMLDKGRKNAKFIDFGLGVIDKDVDLTKEEFVLRRLSTAAGTVMWMAPEMRDYMPNRKYTRMSEFYPVGLLIWFIITRREPFERLVDYARCVIPER
jgi:serine/threonine protein kinase